MRILYRKIQHLNRRIQRKKTGIPGRRPFPRPERRHLHGYRRCLPRDVEVQVTVENQKVTDISILSYCDTEEYFSVQRLT